MKELLPDRFNSNDESGKLSLSLNEDIYKEGPESIGPVEPFSALTNDLELTVSPRRGSETQILEIKTPKGTTKRIGI